MDIDIDIDPHPPLMLSQISQNLNHPHFPSLSWTFRSHKHFAIIVYILNPKDDFDLETDKNHHGSPLKQPCFGGLLGYPATLW